MIHISLGRDIKSKRVESWDVEDMDDLVRFLKSHPSTKDGGAYITPAPMRADVRNRQNAQPASLVGLDFGELTTDEAKKLRSAVREFDAVVWETRNSTSEAPRLRVIVRAKSPILAKDYPATHDALNAELSKRAGVRFTPDSSCRISCQPLFTPPKGSKVILSEGRAFSPSLDVDFSGLVSLKEGKRDADLTSIAGSLRRRGLNENEIYSALSGINQGIPKPLSDREVRKIARSVARYPVNEVPDGLAITSRSAVEIISHPVTARWLHKPYLEEDVLAVMYGDFGTFKTFLGLDLSLYLAAGKPYHNDTRETSAIPCVYISAEGRGLSKRIRAWVRHHFPKEPVDTVLKRLKFYAVEAAVNLSDPDRVSALSAAIEALPERPVMIVVDTLTKNSSGEVEESNSTMTVFLNRLNELRMKYRCTVLLIHHVGHTNMKRARGPISLIANTDAAFQVERTGPFALRLKASG